MIPDLIYDVGVLDGADSAYYLHRGYKVIGIEASPVLGEKLRAKFEREIATGLYTLLNVGIADAPGTAEFWISDHPDWSSFDRDLAARNGTPHHAVQIPTTDFASVISEYGVPFFCKIDIEGNDSCCLNGLTERTAPAYLSVEMYHDLGGEHLDRLNALGYHKFKIVNQVTRAQATPSLMSFEPMMPNIAKKVLRKAIRTGLGVTSVSGWRFQVGSSGSFAEQTPGYWRSLSEVKTIWSRLRDLDARTGGNGLGYWYDIHAKLG